MAQSGPGPAEPGVIGLLEAHGTATPAGDTAELETVAEVFGPPGDAPRGVIGSVKSMIGHTMPAAGIAGLIKAALAVHHGVLPPTLHCDDPHPALARTRFTTVDTAVRGRPTSTARTPRRRQRLRLRRHQRPRRPRTARHRTGRRPPATGGPAAVVGEPSGCCGWPRPPRRAGPAAGPRRRRPARRRVRRERPAPAGPARLGVVEPTAKRLALARKAVDRGRPWRGRNDVWFVPRPCWATRAGGSPSSSPASKPTSTPTATTSPGTSACPGNCPAPTSRSATSAARAPASSSSAASCTPRWSGWTSCPTRSPGTASASGPPWPPPGSTPRTRWTPSSPPSTRTRCACRAWPSR
ncbi:hypothetical protein NKH77_02340 [Streptomyces sp. M19]